MFDADNGSGGYGDALPRYLNLNPLTLLEAVCKALHFLTNRFIE
jgi:hypothetical protein